MILFQSGFRRAAGQFHTVAWLSNQPWKAVKKSLFKLQIIWASFQSKVQQRNFHFVYSTFYLKTIASAAHALRRCAEKEMFSCFESIQVQGCCSELPRLPYKISPQPRTNYVGNYIWTKHKVGIRHFPCHNILESDEEEKVHKPAFSLLFRYIFAKKLDEFSSKNSRANVKLIDVCTFKISLMWKLMLEAVTGTALYNLGTYVTEIDNKLFESKISSFWLLCVDSSVMQIDFAMMWCDWNGIKG